MLIPEDLLTTSCVLLLNSLSLSLIDCFSKVTLTVHAVLLKPVKVTLLPFCCLLNCSLVKFSIDPSL